MSGVITGMASAITYNGVPLTDLGSFKLQVKTETDTFRTLDEPMQKAVACFKEWSMDISIEGTLPARSYGVVSAGGWDGAYLKEWDIEINAEEDDVPAQDLVWKLRSLSGLNWKASSTRWVMSNNAGLFRKALANSDGSLVNFASPIISGQVLYEQTEEEFKPAPNEEKLDLLGSGLFTVGTYWQELVNVFTVYRQQLQSQRYADPGTISIVNVGQGQGYLTKLSAKSDGKRLKIDVSASSYGEPSFT
jgi:hypothetical protein